jgi:osmoprotectant transport system ATP-binding protein
MIVVKNLIRKFGSTIAVKDVSFEVKEGENLVLLGTSGSGKTTTLRMINRLIEPSSGEVLINGISISSQPPEQLRRGIGYVLQNNGLFPHYTVAENIAVVPRLLNWNKEQIMRTTTTLLEKLQLSPAKHGNKYPQELSGGQQQRVGLARALAADPPILLMDEPFGALDPITRVGIRREFLALDELRKKTIILVTHDVQEAFEMGDRICLMDKGQIVQDGTPAELLFRPENDFVKTFLGEQRLQLELKTIKLKDIWTYLGDERQSQPTDSQTINWTQSLWDAMEHWAQPDVFEDELTVTDDANRRKELRFSSIITALNNFKKLY